MLRKVALLVTSAVLIVSAFLLEGTAGGEAPARRRAESLLPSIPTFPTAVGVVPGQVAAMAQKVSADQSAIYGYLAWDRGIWEQVHICEEPVWVVSGGTSDGYFEGGLAISASLYQRHAGHSANLDSPDQQVAIARGILVEVGHGAWASCAKAWLDRLPY